MPMYKRGEDMRSDENLDIGVATIANSNIRPMVCVKFADIEVIFSQAEAKWMRGMIDDALREIEDSKPRIIAPK